MDRHHVTTDNLRIEHNGYKHITFGPSYKMANIPGGENASRGTISQSGVELHAHAIVGLKRAYAVCVQGCSPAELTDQSRLGANLAINAPDTSHECSFEHGSVQAQQQNRGV